MSSDQDDFLRALRPVVEALGATIVPERSSRPGDFPAEWQGETVAYVRTAELHGALGRLVAAVEREIGTGLADMTRAEKQAAVRRLDEQGAFLLRGAVDDVAHWMGVSRVTLYTYLNAIRPDRDGR
ncbi:MAG: helix-turn-helix domain-containing protein [Acidimicrobiia bacterium]|nr:helix-turn-helix domain-containing protein [Acidimicrobiia bacterium]